MDDYVQALETQLAEFAPRAAQHTVDSVYFGGGTPTLLGEKRLIRLLIQFLIRGSIFRIPGDSHT